MTMFFILLLVTLAAVLVIVTVKRIVAGLSGISALMRPL